ncbi:hypothetical protein BJY52DRAFT_303470 [Lactarius psammicola]|nr:hypothetical protein BJY52DRAFT_303470 [Lactarius psammicola]
MIQYVCGLKRVKAQRSALSPCSELFFSRRRHCSIAMPNTLELNCLVFSDDPSHIFTIEIMDTKNVSALKKAIKDEKKHAFQHADADALTLWKVSFPADQNLKANVSELVDAQLLLPLDELSEVFLESPVRKRLHIVVGRPPVLHLDTTPSPPLASPLTPERSLELELNCLVVGEPRSHIFQVKIARTESVGALRHAIKNRKPAFQYVDADSLTVWKVILPFEEALEEILETLFDEASLSPVELLSEVFPEPLIRKHLHIAVKDSSMSTVATYWNRFMTNLM